MNRAYFKGKLKSTENHSRRQEYKNPKSLTQNLQGEQSSSSLQARSGRNLAISAASLPKERKEGRSSPSARSVAPGISHNFSGHEQPLVGDETQQKWECWGFHFHPEGWKPELCQSQEGMCRGIQHRVWHRAGRGDLLKNSNIDPMGHSPGRNHCHTEV